LTALFSEAYTSADKSESPSKQWKVGRQTERGRTMLPYDNRPWARTLAKIVVISSTCLLIALGFFLHSIGQMRISEYVGLLILFLIIVPPNLAVIYRKREGSAKLSQPTKHAIQH
jgi:hypothetical protein